MTAGGHLYRCFFPVGTEAGRDALAANIAAGRTAAGTRITAEGDLDVLDIPDPVPGDVPEAAATTVDAAAPTDAGTPGDPASDRTDEQVAR